MRLAKELRSFIDTANAPIFGIDAQVLKIKQKADGQTHLYVSLRHIHTCMSL